MENNEVRLLLNKYKDGTCTEPERSLLESWYLERNPHSTATLSEDELLEDLLLIAEGLPLHKPAPIIKRWPRIAAAASILLSLSLGTYFILHTRQTPSLQTAQYQLNDIAPGSNSATLTLGNGQKIVLNTASNGQLAIQGNMAVTKTADGQLQYQPISANAGEIMINTIATKRKEQYKVVLSDGTNVWLNAVSSITYPAAFTGRDRVVAITGEAYFEVAHDAKKAFKVTTRDQTVEVLGTHFNINAYTDEPGVKTTLLEGSVKISETHSNSLKIISPGQQAIFKDDNLSVSDANLEEAVAWKNGYFRFNGEKIGSIMRKLSRWYDIDVQFKGPVSDDEFSGTLSRFKHISEVLKALEYYKTVHFEILGRTVIVSK